jgi:predicted nucleotidyltransferase
VKTVLSDTETEVLKLLASDLTREITILKVAQLTGKTTRLTYAAAKKLAKEKTIIIEKKANLRLCKLNLEKIQINAFIESLRWNDFTKKHPDVGLIISTIISKINMPYFTIAIYGSYAKGTATRKSDIDLLVIIPDRKFGNEIEAAVEYARALTNLSLHNVEVTYAEFVSMLRENKITVARETLEARYIAYGAESFYSMIGR